MRYAPDSLPLAPNRCPATGRVTDYAGYNALVVGNGPHRQEPRNSGRRCEQSLPFFRLRQYSDRMLCAESQVAAEPIVGLRDNRPDDYALVGAKVVIAPGKSIDNATILIEDTTIIAVGDDVAVPPGFMQMDLHGRTVYPGLIDAYSEVDVPADHTKTEAVYWNSLVMPQVESRMVASKLVGPIDKLRAQGITVRVVAPKGGIVKGSSAVVLLNDESRGRTLLKPNVWQHAQLTVPKNRQGESYPTSPMGAVALLRQSMYDALWYNKAWDAYRATPSLPRPETNLSLQALSNAIVSTTFVFDTQNERMALRADAIAKEFSLAMIVRGSGQEYRQLDQIAATHRPILLPINFPGAPDVKTAADAREVTLKELMHWHLAPENPAKLSAKGVTICLTTDGLDDPGAFLEKVRIAVKRGLSEDQALAALTTAPAKLLQIDGSVGTIQPGMLANLVITDGSLFESKTKVIETWIAGQQFVIDRSNGPLLDSVAGSWELRFSLGEEQTVLRMSLQRQDEKLTGKLLPSNAEDLEGDDSSEENRSQEDETATPELKSSPLRELVRSRDRITAMVDLSKLDNRFPSGESKLTFVTIDHLEGPLTMLGKIVLPSGLQSEIEVRSSDDVAGEEQEKAKDQEKVEKEQSNNDPAKENNDPAEAVAAIPVIFPLGAYGLTEAIPESPLVMFRGATVWTCDEAGTLDKADVLVRDGRIADVGPNLAVPKDCELIDARGRHITPGLIDCHSHMATDGGVNESGQDVTAEVRIGDFIDNSDISIYRQLAGGLTVANILHGSANPIGGQNQVIKLRWGQTMDGLRMTEAPPGIKFALGENVKGNRSRYPNTRMGVEQILRDQLLAAREYDAAWRRWHGGTHDSLPPRVDLQLEAMSEVQHGQRWIHCHSYRQDEILATLDLLEEFGITIGTLQHILEGYKVADRMAQHGAMGSSFSDWWAYKFEVYDAIPYNGAIMHDQGVVVSFNSDDAELARRLNTEAAKATKYGAVTDQQALQFVTLNPAKQLRIDQYVGSITPGKHADLVLWSGPPLSTTTRCEQTWIDGRKFFDRTRDAEIRDRDSQLHAQLVQLALTQTAEEPKPKKKEEEDRWLRYDEYCGASGAASRNGAGLEATR